MKLPLKPAVNLICGEAVAFLSDSNDSDRLPFRQLEFKRRTAHGIWFVFYRKTSII